MTYPPLPEPTIIDGRMLYTAGDMRAYGAACGESVMCQVDASRIKNNASGQPKTDTVDFLRGMMGMKK